MFSPGFYNRIGQKLDYKKMVHFFCIIVCALLFYSCQQPMDIEIKTNEKRLLVDGEFTTDSVIHTIRLNCPSNLVTGQSQAAVSGATIYITDNIDTYYYIENKNTPGLYQTPNKCCGKGGHTYTLTITNIDIENDGKMESYTAKSLMPVPLKFDSLVSSRGLNTDGKMAVNNWAYYKLFYNGPDFIYKFELLNNDSIMTITDRLGTGEIAGSKYDWVVPKVFNPGSFKKNSSYLSITSTVVKGDTITFICYNFTEAQFEFLKEFDNNTDSGNPLIDNIFDQLRIPKNLPTNIEPSNKTAGYFFIYSVSKISKVFIE